MNRLLGMAAFIIWPALCGCVNEPHEEAWDQLNYTQGQPAEGGTCSDDIANCTVGGHEHGGHGHR